MVVSPCGERSRVPICSVPGLFQNHAMRSAPVYHAIPVPFVVVAPTGPTCSTVPAMFRSAKLMSGNTAPRYEPTPENNSVCSPICTVAIHCLSFVLHATETARRKRGAHWGYPWSHPMPFISRRRRYLRYLPPHPRYSRQRNASRICLRMEKTETHDRQAARHLVRFVPERRSRSFHHKRNRKVPYDVPFVV